MGGWDRAPKTYGSGDVHIVAIDCGIKYNIIRSLVSKGIKVHAHSEFWILLNSVYRLRMALILFPPRGQLTVVPWNWDIKKERYDGLFISNGPGDPAMCEETVNNLRWAIEQARCRVFYDTAHFAKFKRAAEARS